MALGPGCQPDQALLRVIPQLRLGLTTDAIVRAVLDLPGHIHLPRLNILQLSGKILPRVRIDKWHAFIAEYRLGQMPIGRQPNVGPNYSNPAINAKPKAIAFRHRRYGKLFAVVVAGAAEI